MLRDKGVVEYVQAAQLLRPHYPHARFVFAGFSGRLKMSGDSMGADDEWVAEGSVRYWGATSDVRLMIARADCVLPSTGRACHAPLLEACCRRAAAWLDAGLP